MEIMPTDYQNKSLGLEGAEKRFVKNAKSNMQFGFLALNENPAKIQGEKLHILICPEGVLYLRFFNDIKIPIDFDNQVPIYKELYFDQTTEVISHRLFKNISLVAGNGKLRFPVNLIYVFPELKEREINALNNKGLQSFIPEHCWFYEDLKMAEGDFDGLLKKSFTTTIVKCAEPKMVIADNNVNSILRSVVPEYTGAQGVPIEDEETKAGADDELLYMTEKDKAARAFHLDKDQINIVNRISKGERLILAAAGSGKTALLIAKCYKAAEENTDKKFLITCFNDNLHDFIQETIDDAGLFGTNVECYTFHALCRKLLLDNNFNADYINQESYNTWAKDVITRFNEGKIKNRYYGIFIDEIQLFQSEWYKLCYNLLENRNSEEHLFVICGDEQQDIRNLQRHGHAIWNEGEVGKGYPSYRGKKTIRLEKNYRNSIEINNYVRRFLDCAQNYLSEVQRDNDLDPALVQKDEDQVQMGESNFHGPDVVLGYLENKTSNDEAKMVIDYINEIHKEIPYSEIAVIMYNGKYNWKIPGWQENKYVLQNQLEDLLDDAHIDCRKLYKDNDYKKYHNDNTDSVSLVKMDACLGLDFRAVIVCGLLPLGQHDKTKTPDWNSICSDKELIEKKVNDIHENINRLYGACTRAKEVLRIILPETGKDSIYIKMLEDAVAPKS